MAGRVQSTALEAPVRRDRAADNQPSQAVPPEYAYVALAGRGSFADVWKARERATGQWHAVKQLRPDCAHHEAARRLLANEREVLATLHARHVVGLRAANLRAAIPYLALEWLEGTTLERHLAARGQLPCADALWIARQCACGMQELLQAGFLHGDIKPANVFIERSGNVRLIDLGFARPDLRSAATLTERDLPRVYGTPEYMAPEALLPWPRNDIDREIFSLGVIMFRMLTGRLPHAGDSVEQILRWKREIVPTSIRAIDPAVPAGAARLVARMLSKQPLRRGNGLAGLVHELVGLELALERCFRAGR